MWLKFLTVVLVAFAVAHAASRDRNTKKYKVVCYLGSWANYRQGDGKFLIEHIDPFLCTHLVYGFAKLGPNNQIAAYDPYLDLKENWGLGAFERFNGLKKKNPELTTILAIGGWNEGSVKYSAMAKTAETRAVFVKSCVDFLLKYDFDGLDMDWEYPANRGGAPEDKQTFILLLKELQDAFKPHGLIVTAAVSAGKATIDTAYDIAGMGKYLDIINLMAYDFHGSWENFAGHNAPLYPRPEESEFQKVLNVDYAVNYWLKGGAPPEKLVLGMGLYGRSFTLAKASENGIDAPVSGKGEAGPITREGGMLGYNEICKFLGSGWTEVWAKGIEAPYAYKDRQWVGYDNEKSIGIKVDYLLEKKLGGGMVWSLETDDFRGNCGGKKYPLLEIINDKLNGPVDRNTLPPRPTEGTGATKATGATDTPDVTPGIPDGDSAEDDGTYINCQNDGIIKHPNDCQKFVVCKDSKYKLYRCGSERAFDEKKGACVPKNEVAGC